MITTILGECNAVAGASGGVFGIGAHSSVESKRIKELAAALGVSSWVISHPRSLRSRRLVTQWLTSGRSATRSA